jgi:hypothetical protein
MSPEAAKIVCWTVFSSFAVLKSRISRVIFTIQREAFRVVDDITLVNLGIPPHW